MTFWLLVGLLTPVVLAIAIRFSGVPATQLPRGAVVAIAAISRARASVAHDLGRLGAFTMLALSGAAATIAVLWSLGAVLQKLGASTDALLYTWLSQAYLGESSAWTRLNETVTQIGDPWPMLVVVIVGGVSVSTGWPARRWVPPFVLFVALVSEWFMQRILAAVINRGYPPFGNGTYPSGGSARVLLIYGLIVYLAILAWPTMRPYWRGLVWSAVGIMAVVEGYSRLYLLKHWPSDVPAGWLLGVMLLTVLILSTPALGSPRRMDPEVNATQ